MAVAGSKMRLKPKAENTEEDTTNQCMQLTDVSCLAFALVSRSCFAASGRLADGEGLFPFGRSTYLLRTLRTTSYVATTSYSS